MFSAVDLASVLTPEVMAPILANPEVQQRLKGDRKTQLLL